MTKSKTIEFLGIRTLRGPNIWTYRTTVEALIDIGALEECPSNTLPGFNERLAAWLPGLIEHHCSPGVRGGFLMRLSSGTWAGHILEHVSIELLNLAGCPVHYGRARETHTAGVYKVALKVRDAAAGRAALYAARDLVMAAIEDRPFDVAGCIAALRKVVESHALGPSTACIVDAADERGIPIIRLTEGNLVQLGYGCLQRRIWTAESDATSAIAQGVARDKDLTRQLLSTCGVPVPWGRPATNADDAVEAASGIGGPVVVKPLGSRHGRGVSLALAKEDDIRAAYALAQTYDNSVIVEQFIPGDEHRILVVNGKAIAAIRGEPLFVTGDGAHSIAELIELQINSDPRRSQSYDSPLYDVRLDRDSEVVLELERQGVMGRSVPAAGTKILIQRNGNHSIDVTDRMHPANAALVSLAARIIGLDIAGVDLVTGDISKPLKETGGAIIEINAGPGLDMHLHPIEGKPRPVGEAIVDYLFPEGGNGRIPIVGVSGTRGTTLAARLTGWLLHLTGSKVGTASADGFWLGARRTAAGPCASFSHGQRLLMNSALEAAVIETDALGILSEGIPYRMCRIGVVTASDDDPRLRDHHIPSPDKTLFDVLRTQIDVVEEGGIDVLNADDPLAPELDALWPTETIYFSRNAESPVIAAHRQKGGRAVVLLDGRIRLLKGGAADTLNHVDTLAFRDGSEETDVSMLAAVSAAWGFGMGPELIRTGLSTFERTAEATDAAHLLWTPPAKPRLAAMRS